MGDDLRPGWYTAEGGQRRYWTGSEWLVPDSSLGVAAGSQLDTAAEALIDGMPLDSQGDLVILDSTPDRHQRKRRSPLLLIALVLVVIGVAAVGLLAIHQHREDRAREAAALAEAERIEALVEEQRAEEEARQIAEEQREEEQRRVVEQAIRVAEQERKARELLDERFTSGAVGEVFEVIQSGTLYFRYMGSDEFTCGYWNCVGVAVYTMDGCPGGVYLDASVLDSSGTVVGYANTQIGPLRADEQGAELLETTVDWSDSFRVETVNCMQ